MNERPILFNGEMVRAILDGRKTQTRRVVRPTVSACTVGYYCGPNGDITPVNVQEDGDPWYDIPSPFGQIGDRLWVRETCFIHNKPNEREPNGTVYYAADIGPGGPGSKPTPSIHMPRWASRITLEITAVRVERLQDISEADAKAEGPDWMGLGPYTSADELETPRDGFSRLWDSFAKPGEKWKDNPWVWVYKFKKLEESKP